MTDLVQGMLVFVLGYGSIICAIAAYQIWKREGPIYRAWKARNPK